MKKKNWNIIIILLIVLIVAFLVLIWLSYQKEDVSPKQENESQTKKMYQCIHRGTITLEDINVTADFARSYKIPVDDQNHVLSKEYTITYTFSTVEDMNAYYEYRKQRPNQGIKKEESKKTVLVTLSVEEDYTEVNQEYLDYLKKQGYNCFLTEE